MNDNSIIEEINTWTTPFYVTQMPDHDFLKDALLAAVYQQKSL